MHLIDSLLLLVGRLQHLKRETIIMLLNISSINLAVGFITFATFGDRGDVFRVFS